MGLTLKAARERRKLTVDQLAELSGVTRSSLYRLESGETPDPSHSTVRSLETALGLKRGALVFPAAEPAGNSQPIAADAGDGK